MLNRNKLMMVGLGMSLAGLVPCSAMAAKPSFEVWAGVEKHLDVDTLGMSNEVKVGAGRLQRFNLMIADNKVIKNAPYTAEAISEIQQKLADGNLISTQSSFFVARDAAGRTREEFRNAKNEITQIVISDPETGRLIVNPRNKSVTKLGDFVKQLGGREANAKSQVKDGAQVFELMVSDGEATSGGKHIIVRESHSQAESGKVAEVNKQVNVQVRGATMTPPTELMSGGVMDPARPHLLGDGPWSSKRQTKSLGSRFIEGVKADGKLSSYEIPAGAIGNAQAIIVSDETWVSPELGVTLYSKHSDPRSGDRIYRLNKLKRVDSDPAIFSAPADYKVVDVLQSKKLKFKMETN